MKLNQNIVASNATTQKVAKTTIPMIVIRARSMRRHAEG
jgi:hypothetical protein